MLVAWLGCMSMIGIYNIFKWNPLVVQALSPYYIYKFFKNAGKDGWSSLCGIVLCITGAEAMFADLGHFSKLSLRIAFALLVYPSLVLSYMGEAAYLSKNKEDLHTSFYKSIPGSIFWPVFVIATLASIVGSQATISATFSIINQCRALSCFPRVKIIHTSNQVYGQIYIPEVNWILLFLSISTTIGFRDTSMIGNAYGLTVIIVMIITTCLMFLIITTVWKKHIVLALLFIIIFGFVELLYLSACLTKVPHGGWLPLSLSLLMLSVMAIWHYGSFRKQAYELQNKVHIDNLLTFSHGLGLTRVPGIGLIYSSTSIDIPPMFAHFITNFPAFHRVLIFVCLQTVAIPKVPNGRQFLIRRIGSPEYLLFRCIIRNGYKDVRKDAHEFEDTLLDNIAEFLQGEGGSPNDKGKMPTVDWPSDSTEKSKLEGVELVKHETGEFLAQREAGVAYMIGQTSIVAHGSSSFIKKIVINHLYDFLCRNCRQPAVALGIPPSSLIEVGMVYSV